MSLVNDEVLLDFFNKRISSRKDFFDSEKFKICQLTLSSLGLIDKDLINEILSIVDRGVGSIYFGKTLMDIKCVIREENSQRCHEVFVKYVAPKKLIISSANLPYSSIQDREFRNMEDILTAYESYVKTLSGYFYELERIDQFCTVMEPVIPTFKDDYRKILLDNRTWLHVEVTPTGCAANVHLVGHSATWQAKLQSGLLAWDHDKDIVENIMSVFDIMEFPVTSKGVENDKPVSPKPEQTEPTPATCGICLSVEFPEIAMLPQPLCRNPKCGIYFHRNCLYEWLVACTGSCPPAIGVATGACPACLQPIACSEKDT